MANLTVNSEESIVKGTYNSGKFNYNVNYVHSDGNLKSFNVSINDSETNAYQGMINLSDNGSLSVTCNNPSDQAEHTNMVLSLIEDARIRIGGGMGK